MISINLLPDVKKQLLRVRRERNLVVTISIFAMIVAGGVLAVLSGTLGALSIAKALTENSINKSKEAIQDAIDNKQLNQYLTIQNQLSQIDGLKGDQQIYSRILGYLTELNPASPNNAQLQTVSLSNESGDGISMTLEGSVANFPALDVYRNTLASAELLYHDRTDEDEEGADDTSDASSESRESNSSSDSSSSDDAGSNSSNDDSSDDNESNQEEDYKRVKLFTSVSVVEQGLSSGEDEVSFTISATFCSEAFSSDIQDQRVEVPHETTSDGDRNAPTTSDDDDATQQETFHTDETDQTTTEGGNQ